MVTKKKPLALSIIIPAYNEQKHLVKCLDSIKVQSVMPGEVLVVDNNSKDQTAQIAKSYDFVTVINEKFQGVVFARNKGFNRAKYDILARIDADSILPEDWVESVLNIFKKNSKTEFAFTGGGYFYNVPMTVFFSWAMDQVAFRLNKLLIGHFILFGSNMAIQKSTWERVKNVVCLRVDVHEDLDLAIHINRLDIPIVYRPDIKVGVKMRRVFEDYSQLWGNMMMWPRTLRVHRFSRWFLPWIGGVFLFALSPIILWPMKATQKAIGYVRYKN